MNVNNQSTSNLKQVKIQMPITALSAFTKSMDELVTMYPKNEDEKTERDDYEIKD